MWSFSDVVRWGRGWLIKIERWRKCEGMLSTRLSVRRRCWFVVGGWESNEESRLEALEGWRVGVGCWCGCCFGQWKVCVRTRRNDWYDAWIDGDGDGVRSR